MICCIFRVSQLPIKGIPIASVSIPVVASTGGSTGPAQANPVLTIPVVSKQDGASHIVNNVTIAAGGKSLSSTQVGSAQSSSTVRGLLANAIHKQNSLSSGGSSNMQVLQLPQTGVQLQNGQVRDERHIFWLFCCVYVCYYCAASVSVPFSLKVDEY